MFKGKDFIDQYKDEIYPLDKDALWNDISSGLPDRRKRGAMFILLLLGAVALTSIVLYTNTIYSVDNTVVSVDVGAQQDVELIENNQENCRVNSFVGNEEKYVPKNLDVSRMGNLKSNNENTQIGSVASEFSVMDSVLENKEFSFFSDSEKSSSVIIRNKSIPVKKQIKSFALVKGYTPGILTSDNLQSGRKEILPTINNELTQKIHPLVLTTNKWSVSGGLELLHFTYDSDNSIDDPYFINEPNPLFGMSSSLAVSHRLTERNAVFASLSYTVLNERFSFDSDTTMQVEVVTQNGVVTVSDLIERRIRHTNHLKYIDFGFGVSHSQPCGLWGLGIQSSLHYRRLLGYNGKMQISNGDIMEFSDKQSVLSMYAESALYYSIGFHLEYRLYRQSSLAFEYNHSRDLSKALKTINSNGIRFVLKYCI